jgi:hypothetical protein
MKSDIVEIILISNLRMKSFCSKLILSLCLLDHTEKRPLEFNYSEDEQIKEIIALLLNF